MEVKVPQSFESSLDGLREPSPVAGRSMRYRELLYSTYVSSNKHYVYQAAHGARAREKGIRNALWFLRPWLPSVHSQPRILDLGCGPGNLLAALERAGYTDLSGVDISAEQVAIARRSFPGVEQADVFEYLGREELGSFDLITAFDLLEHLTRDEASDFLRLVHGRLRSGGSLVLQLPNGDSPFAGSVYWSDLTHETQYTAISLRHLLEACGFRGCEFQEHGPTPLSAAGMVRTVLWKGVRLGIRALHLVETGMPSTGIYTRTFRCRATKS
jgi:2-polyprenyl-3-methyl-5-hydroxy-6-metoxy-1,4-benzoquinol methylase